MTAFANVRRGLNLSAGTGLAQTGTVVFSNSNGVTFGMQTSGSSHVITASATGGITNAIQSLSAGTTRITSGQAVLANSNGFSFGVNGQTITVRRPTLSYWDNHYPLAGAASIPGESSTLNLTIQRASFALPLTATRADLVMSMLVDGSTAGSVTFALGIYTFAGSTASSASSSSVAVTWNSGTNSTAASIYGGQSLERWRSIPLGTWNITPGDYLVGFLISISGVAGSTASWSMFGETNASVLRAPANAAQSAYFNDGIFSTGTGAFPSSMHLSAINQTFSGFGIAGPVQPYLQLAGTF